MTADRAPTVEVKHLTFHPSMLSVDGLQDVLNHWGAEGWEVVRFLPVTEFVSVAVMHRTKVDE